MIQFQTPFIRYLRNTLLQSLRVAPFNIDAYLLCQYNMEKQEWLSSYLNAFLYTSNKYTWHFYMTSAYWYILQLIYNCVITFNWTLVELCKQIQIGRFLVSVFNLRLIGYPFTSNIKTQPRWLVCFWLRNVGLQSRKT